MRNTLLFGAILAAALCACTRDDRRESRPAPADAAPAERTGEAHDSRIAFERDGVWIADGGGRGAERLCDGYDPEISPDGRRVAFTRYAANGDRAIAIADVATRRVTVLRAVPGTNNYGPRWSPDGTRLLFHHFADGTWYPAIVDAGDSRCRVLVPDGVEPPAGGWSAPFWAPNGRILYCTDLAALWELDTAGRVRSTTPIDVILGKRADSLGISSATRFSCTRDGNAILFDAELEEYLPSGASAVFLFDMRRRLLDRLSPYGMSAASPSWQGGRVICDGFPLTKENVARMREDREVRCDLYLLSPDAAPRVVLANATRASASAPER
jgi:TolB protein